MSNYKFLLCNALLSERMMHLQDNKGAPRAPSTSRMQSAGGLFLEASIADYYRIHIRARNVSEKVQLHYTFSQCKEVRRILPQGQSDYLAIPQY